MPRDFRNSVINGIHRVGESKGVVGQMRFKYFMLGVLFMNAVAWCIGTVARKMREAQADVSHHVHQRRGSRGNSSDCDSGDIADAEGSPLGGGAGTWVPVDRDDHPNFGGARTIREGGPFAQVTPEPVPPSPWRPSARRPGVDYTHE